MPKKSGVYVYILKNANRDTSTCKLQLLRGGGIPRIKWRQKYAYRIWAPFRCTGGELNRSTQGWNFDIGWPPQSCRKGVKLRGNAPLTSRFCQNRGDQGGSTNHIMAKPNILQNFRSLENPEISLIFLTLWTQTPSFWGSQTLIPGQFLRT